MLLLLSVETFSIGTRLRSMEEDLWPLTEAMWLAPPPEGFSVGCSWETTLLARMAQELCQSARLVPTPFGKLTESDR